MSDFRNSKLDERYRNDPTFNRAVTSIYKMIAEFGITPSELREAIFLAHYKYEMENPQAMQHRIFASMANIYMPKVTTNKNTVE